jgi:hypothetical protein
LFLTGEAVQTVSLLMVMVYTLHAIHIIDEMTADLSKELWYHGRVSRSDAEHLLEQRGNVEGSFLVRDSLTTTGEYVLSLCHQVCD